MKRFFFRPVQDNPVPRDLQPRTYITIDGEKFEIEADDLESICELGRGAYGVVEKMKHKKTGNIIAVKVSDTFIGNSDWQQLLFA